MNAKHDIADSILYFLSNFRRGFMTWPLCTVFSQFYSIVQLTLEATAMPDSITVFPGFATDP